MPLTEYGDDVIDLAKNVLQRWGYIERNGMLFSKEYQDEKIYISVNVLDVEGNNEDLYLAIKARLDTEEFVNTPQFGISRRQNAAENLTTVYFSRDLKHTHFERPGKWMEYLEKLGRKASDEFKRERKLNGVPIDDSRLFPEIEDSKVK